MSNKNKMSKKANKNEIDETFLDQTLRPTRFEEYVGQNHIKKNLKILLEAAAGRNHPPEHLLFYGPPGLGKTTLAHLIAKETGKQIKITSGPAIERVGDLASILTNLSPGDILFIDEVHRLNKAVEEVLYPAMESGVLDIIIGKGPSARTIQLDLPPFTLIAATTRIALLSSPLRSRFSGGVFRLEFYSEDEVGEIIKRSAQLLQTELDEVGRKEIAKRSRFTPRTANYLLKRCRDYAQVNKKKLNKDMVSSALNLLEIDELGLNSNDRKILEVIIEKFGGGPVGLNTVAAATSEEEATIEEVIEPYLIQLGLLERTPRGRAATRKAYEHLDFNYPENNSSQEKLL
ncbi:Holliday junction DNA helicase RuvB [Candidatus Nomurabacteria bacterium RIFCSPLOWO2_01_FULL_42_20]|uniref:Holliday junction branch migration complex subunit RuvB n=1 Tax=Candidatus Nomurabacteria bacterium RIFCSPHIGHO2_01_FULL_42_16 TaxID=1801743 RepID=A0A1F6VHQ9_9BACT|nr:MAG: Holliday junction DNA helicase RuvB [Candidatus Nomurabacteria bacterium RIFCSPHIGHO2_01_FULL_42_16]OGI91324.1 MAG: Holliday junction DNA helicase RuvB [Candidatus Nomurabacteria bacterium RIFCSPLOWO2_01_FULL_42_20]